MKQILIAGRRPTMTYSMMHFAVVATAALLLVSQVATAQARRVTAIVEKTFGTSTHPDSLLQGIADVARAPDGSVIASDGMARNLKVFDSTGKLVRLIGRRGSGPGEFQFISRIAVANDGNIFVPEGGRIQSFALNGTPLTSFKITPIGEVPIGYSVTADGRFQLATAMVASPPRPVGRDSASLTAAITSAGTRTLTIDSLVRLRWWKSESDSGSVTLSTGGPQTPAMILSAMSLWARNSSGTMVVSSGARPVFRFYSPDGRIQRQTTLPTGWRATPISTADADFLFAKYVESLVPPGGNADLVAGMRAGADRLRRTGFAQVYPAHAGLLLGDDERIWAQLPVTAADLRNGQAKAIDLRGVTGSAEWQVYSGAGALLMQVTMPAGFRAWRIVGDRIYGHALNSNDEPVVQILRIPR